MKILFFLRYFRDQASSRVRGFDMAEELKRRGINCGIIYGSGKKNLLSFLLKLMKYDVIYFQKRYSERDIKLNKLARMIGRKTFFDIDDNPLGVNLNPKRGRQAETMMKISSAVIVGSHKLRDFAQDFNKHVCLIPSPVDLNYYTPKKNLGNPNYTTLGWIGNGIVYKNDLQMLIKPLESLGGKYSIKLTLIGALGQEEIYENFGRLRNIRLEIIDWVSSVDPLAVPSSISDFDIGLYPLINSEYNLYKCSLKALEYMAMEVPVIASPVGENRIVIDAGENGFLASNAKEWEENISYLIENESVRKRMGKLGRRKIQENYSTEVCASKLIKVFENVEG